MLRSTPRIVRYGSRDVDGLLVDPLVDEDQVAFLGRVDRGLDGLVVVGDEDRLDLAAIPGSAGIVIVVVVTAARDHGQHRAPRPRPRTCPNLAA